MSKRSSDDFCESVEPNNDLDTALTDAFSRIRPPGRRQVDTEGDDEER